MTFWTNGSAEQQGQSSGELLTTLASHVDQQLILDLGGEFLPGSGFEAEIPEPDFGPEEESNV